MNRALHETETVRDGRAWRAICSCSWRSTLNPTKRNAQLAAVVHQHRPVDRSKLIESARPMIGGDR